MTTTEYERGQALGAPASEIECCNCGIRFIVPHAFFLTRYADHQGFYCPLGHELSYPVGPTSLELANRKLNQEIASHDQTRARLEREQQRHERTEMRRRAAKGQLTKAKNRISKGVCPCCNRQFENLSRHMASKHPDYSSDKEQA